MIFKLLFISWLLISSSRGEWRDIRDSVICFLLAPFSLLGGGVGSGMLLARLVSIAISNLLPIGNFLLDLVIHILAILREDILEVGLEAGMDLGALDVGHRVDAIPFLALGLQSEEDIIQEVGSDGHLGGFDILVNEIVEHD